MGYHILIADDEKRIVYNMKQIIEDAFSDAVEIRIAVNGLECLQLMNNWQVDLLITDIRMPGADGIELVKKIRETDKQTEILVISAYEDFRYAKALIPYGVMDYLVKPISVDQILNRVDSAMKKEKKEGLMPEETSEEQTEAEKYQKNALLKEAEHYIHQNLYQPLSLNDVADFLHVNKSYLSTVFKNQTGETISNYINMVKMKEAKKLLLETEDSVSGIAEKLGYSTSKYFIEKFSKSTGMTPAKFRGLLRKNI